jgi:hypothetical protein
VYVPGVVYACCPRERITGGQRLCFTAKKFSLKDHTPEATEVVGSFGLPMILPLPIYTVFYLLEFFNEYAAISGGVYPGCVGLVAAVVDAATATSWSQGRTGTRPHTASTAATVATTTTT